MAVLLSTSRNFRLITSQADLTIAREQLQLTIGAVPQLTLTLGTPSQQVLTLGTPSTIVLSLGGDPVGFDDTINYFKGEKLDIPLLFEDSPGNPHDLVAGDLIEFIIKQSFGNTTNLLKFTSADVAEIEKLVPTNLGTATLKLIIGTLQTVEVGAYQWMMFLNQGGVPVVRNPWGGGCFNLKDSLDP